MEGGEIMTNNMENWVWKCKLMDIQLYYNEMEILRTYMTHNYDNTSKKGERI